MTDVCFKKFSIGLKKKLRLSKLQQMSLQIETLELTGQ